MKTCKDCIHYKVCKENDDLYHVSRLTPDGDIVDRCRCFEDKLKEETDETCQEYCMQLPVHMANRLQKQTVLNTK